MKKQILLLALFLLLNSGCTVLAVGGASAIGGSYYLNGEIKAKYPVSIYHLYEVALYTFQEEGIKTVSVKNTTIDADIIGRKADGEKVSVHIYYDKDEYGVLGIRFGTFGDEKQSRQLLSKMEEYI